MFMFQQCMVKSMKGTIFTSTGKITFFYGLPTFHDKFCKTFRPYDVTGECDADSIPSVIEIGRAHV